MARGGGDGNFDCKCISTIPIGAPIYIYIYIFGPGRQHPVQHYLYICACQGVRVRIFLRIDVCTSVSKD